MATNDPTATSICSTTVALSLGVGLLGLTACPVGDEPSGLTDGCETECSESGKKGKKKGNKGADGSTSGEAADVSSTTTASTSSTGTGTGTTAGTTGSLGTTSTTVTTNATTSSETTLGVSSSTTSPGGDSSGSTGETSVDDRCDVGVFDASDPPQSLALSGNLGAHDPVIIPAHGQYYYFSTGNGIAAKTSPDLLSWQQQPEIFPSTPAWFQQLVPDYEPRNIWAPDISYFGGQYHLYYSVSSFGDNRSCIGHLTRTALDSGSWTDHEDTICSNQPGQNHNWNAIDPNVVLDDEGTPWMSFGSFWSGIKMIELDQQGEQATPDVYDIASRGGGSIEAPYIVRRCGYYYLFVSFGSCCQGANSTYEIRVGRSDDVLGPYVDSTGTPMMNGGGDLLVSGDGTWAGPGHNAILIDGTNAYNVHHAFRRTNGFAELRIAELAWDDQGWPVTAGP